MDSIVPNGQLADNLAPWAREITFHTDSQRDFYSVF